VSHFCFAAFSRVESSADVQVKLASFCRVYQVLSGEETCIDLPATLVEMTSSTSNSYVNELVFWILGYTVLEGTGFP